MPVIRLPMIQMNENQYFVDKRLGQLRNIKNPLDCIPFDEAFVKVSFRTEHLVLNDPDAIRKAREDIRLTVRDAYEFEEIENLIDTEPASTKEVTDHLEELLEELENDNDQKE